MRVVVLTTICLLFILPRVFSEGFISLSCGSPRQTKFQDEVTGISYISDAEFIATGVSSKIKSSYQSKTVQKNWHLRSFPRGLRNCYTFKLTSGDMYLIRTNFFHGGYDDNPSTDFSLHLGPNEWEKVSTANETDEKSFEIIHMLTRDRLQLCLVKTGDSTPFISSIEMRRLYPDSYNFSHGSLKTFSRLDIGSKNKHSSREDAFGRIWLPNTLKSWSTISTNKSVNIQNAFQLPWHAMATASVPTEADAPMNISLTGVHPASTYFVFLHLAEIQELNQNETREFDIMYNGKRINGPYSITKNGQYIFSLQRTKRSTLPPLLNAMEIYLWNGLPEQETGTKEGGSINLTTLYGANNIKWEGDPCAPLAYKWDGIDCRYVHNEPPTITYLNLTANGLTGEILDSISNLTSLQLLDLSNNSLNGSVPEFLANMDSLKLINLSSNQLSGSIPTRLLDKVQMGSVSLRYKNCGYELDKQTIKSFKSFEIRLDSRANKNNEEIITIVASVGASLVLILVIAAALLLIFRRKRRAMIGGHLNSDLAQATGNFSSSNLIGQGGFGHVHRGVLTDGTEVAVKQLKAGSGQGEREFQAEIEVISRVHHRHLVSLLGYCTTRSQRLLVYEFVPNKTLEFHLHDIAEKGGPVMEWECRMKIALGSSKGLSYLHDDCNPKTIHRDVKAANILIDDSYEAKVADFGLARCCSDTETHVSTRIMGTFGYLAPEYASSGHLTDKSDVFSFGVVLLELITGRRPVDKSQPFADDDSIVDWAKPLMIQALNDGNFDGLVDPRLEDNFDTSEMARMVACAAASVRHSAKRRPKMSQDENPEEASCRRHHEDHHEEKHCGRPSDEPRDYFWQQSQEICEPSSSLPLVQKSPHNQNLLLDDYQERQDGLYIVQSNHRI
ncbi:hypothetical protein EUTSA_v10011979mg, partial [Eutrema salsugineum]